MSEQETPRPTKPTLLVVVQRGSTHEQAVACVLTAAASARHLAPHPIGGMSSLTPDLAWERQDDAPLTVRVASKAQMQDLAHTMHLSRVPVGHAAMGRSRVLVVAPRRGALDFRGVRDLDALSPSGLSRDATGYYVDSLRSMEAHGRPVLRLDVADDVETFEILKVVAHLGFVCRRAFLSGETTTITPRHATAWRNDGYRTTVCFASRHELSQASGSALIVHSQGGSGGFPAAGPVVTLGASERAEHAT